MNRTDDLNNEIQKELNSLANRFFDADYADISPREQLYIKNLIQKQIRDELEALHERKHEIDKELKEWY